MLFELLAAGGEIGAPLGVSDRRELLLDALQRCSGSLGIALLQGRPGLVELGPDRGRRLHRAGVVAIERLSHAPQAVTGLRGLGDQAHCREGNHHHGGSCGDRAEHRITAADRPAAGADRRQRGVDVDQVTERLGIHLLAPSRQDASQLVVVVTRAVASSADHVQQRVVGLHRSQISGHLMRIPVGITATGEVVSTRHSDHPLSSQHAAQPTEGSVLRHPNRARS